MQKACPDFAWLLIKKKKPEGFMGNLSSSVLALFFFCMVILDLPISKSSILQRDDRSSRCKENCGSTSVPYPFYLDPQCRSAFPGLNLECSGKPSLLVKLGGVKYNILAISSDSLVVDALNSSCEISPRAFTFRGNEHYGISLDNFLQLSNCKNSSACLVNCNIPLHQNKTDCRFNATCCYPLSNSILWEAGISSIESFSRFRCSGFSSWVLSSSSANSVEAKFGLKLEWAVQGNCSTTVCAANAFCVNATTIKGGVRCQCKSGYVGDGFSKGMGCIGVCVTKDGNVAHDKYCGDQKSLIDIIIIAAGMLGAATILVGVVIAFALLRHRRYLASKLSRNRDIRQLANLLSFNGKSCTTKLFTYKELEKATKGFSENEKLGNGACGTVYAGKVTDGSLVAVKRIHFGSTQATEQIINEVSVLSTVRHQNLVRLLGCCLEVDIPLLVYEFVPNGTLAEHLQRERGEGLNWLTRISIATETADAIAFLHTSIDPPIYHRDVKSSNILLDYDFNAKVSDFGLSRPGVSEGSHISTIPQGTPGYLDPEYHQNFHLSDKSDVYSFGVVLVEIITGMKPLDFTRDKKEVTLAALAVSKISSNCLDDIIDPFLQHDKQQPLLRELVQRVAEIAFRCLSYDKDARPTMLEVAEELALINKDSMHLRSTSPQGIFKSGFETKLLHKFGIPISSVPPPWTRSKSSVSCPI